MRKRAEWSQKSSRRQPLGDDRPFDALSKGMHIEDKHLQTKKELSDTLTQLVESEKENEKLSAELIDATEKLDKLESEKTFIQEALKKEVKVKRFWFRYIVTNLDREKVQQLNWMRNGNQCYKNWVLLVRN